VEKKILEIVSWYEKPDWNQRLIKYALSLSSAQLAIHIEAFNTEINRDKNPHDMLIVARGCFTSVLKRKLNL